MWQSLIIIIALLLLLFLIVVVIDSNRFVITSYEVKSSKVKKEHTFVLLADLHNKVYGRSNRRLLEAVSKEKPEGILIAGDILTSKPGCSLKVAGELIAALTEKYPVYYGMGNHETRLFLYPEVYGDMGREYERLLKEKGISLMKNISVDLEDNIRVVGLDLERRFYRRFKKTPMEEEYLVNVLGKSRKDRYQILLAHNPDYFEEYSSWGADLVLSGHVHGGMMRLPGLGGVISPSFRLFPKYDGGRFREGESTMILSRGLGMHTIPLRIFNPGELVVIRLLPDE